MITTVSGLREAASSSSRRAGDGGAGRRHIRYAVVGLGHIAQAAVLPAFQHARKNSRLAALVSDDPEKLRAMGRKFKPEFLHTYDEFDSLCESGEIDAAYIALPNHLHAEYAIRAADRGIHVLCEKPMGVNEQECRRMIEARDRNNVRMMIAYRLHFEKANLAAVDMAKAGKLGEIRFFNSTFSFNVKAGNIRTQAEMGGGTVFDIGIYCINAARYLFQDEPIEVVAMSAARRDDPRFEEIDEMTSAVLRFPGERLASFTCCFGAAPTAAYDIVGSKGHLRVENAYEYTEDITHRLTVNGRTKQKKFPRRDQFAPELLYFSNCILKDQSPEPSAEEGLIDVRIINAIYQSAEQGGEPVYVGELPADPMPDGSQEMRKPPVGKPKLVKVESASEE